MSEDSLDIPLGRRIAEIMKEKGSAYSHQAMGKRIGVSRETLRLMLHGGREIYDFEVKKICVDLKLSVERIKQQDTWLMLSELQQLLKHEGRDPKRALEIANHLQSVAIGMTERCKTLFYLGQAHKNLHQYEPAHQAWLEAYDLAKAIYDKYGETDLLYSIISNLVTTYTIRKDFTRAAELLAMVEDYFLTTPIKSASLTYSRSKLLESLGEVQTAREVSYDSLKYARSSNNSNVIGRALINAAHFEFKLREYKEARHLLVLALEELQQDPISSFIAKKELAKCLIKLGEKAEAEDIILSALSDLEGYELPKLKAKNMLLLSILRNSPENARAVADDNKCEKDIRYLSYKFLIGYYKSSGDSELFMEYLLLPPYIVRKLTASNVQRLTDNMAERS
ncbi:hypothetical protein OS242_16945 [Tumebacillus sp. DT12]|uniref:HTH cro/C1-type domain-containing protein n=1 Tax=Tumebacillus lacus TaxID=2995335 RepID=A0ABT3X5D2_9BACL|nr:hypothetical protein [Tumebacillus lacus]MCX7571631.1 hypothetical protein [Tumebacillus lacus]